MVSFKGLFSWNLFMFAFLEVILVGWVYGIDQFIKDLDHMELPIRHYIAIYLKIALKYASPVVFTILIVVDSIRWGKNLGQGESIPSIIENLQTFSSIIKYEISKQRNIWKAQVLVMKSLGALNKASNTF